MCDKYIVQGMLLSVRQHFPLDDLSDLRVIVLQLKRILLAPQIWSYPVEQNAKLHSPIRFRIQLELEGRAQ